MSQVWFSEACIKTLLAGNQDAASWIELAPARLAQLADEHGVALGTPLLGGHTGIVATGTRGSQGVVCKLVLEPKFAAREATSLYWLAATGRVPQVVAADVEAGFLVTSLLEPGTTELVNNLDAVAALAQSMHATPTTRDMPTVMELVAERSEALERHCQTLGLGGELLHQALTSVSQAAAAAVTCHGDFGPSNVLDGPGGVLWAIDPECVAGPAAFDLAGFAIRRGSATAIDTALTLARLTKVPEGEVMAWLSWMAFDEAVSHTAYGLPVAAAEWELAVTLGALPRK